MIIGAQRLQSMCSLVLREECAKKASSISKILRSRLSKGDELSSMDWSLDRWSQHNQILYSPNIQGDRGYKSEMYNLKAGHNLFIIKRQQYRQKSSTNDLLWKKCSSMLFWHGCNNFYQFWGLVQDILWHNLHTAVTKLLGQMATKLEWDWLFRESK